MRPSSTSDTSEAAPAAGEAAVMTWWVSRALGVSGSQRGVRLARDRLGLALGLGCARPCDGLVATDNRLYTTHLARASVLEPDVLDRRRFGPSHGHLWCMV